MKVVKEAKTAEAHKLCSEDLIKINEFAKKTLTNDEIFTFEMLLCDNDVDRDYERFETSALEKLGELFVGRTGIFDHQWSAKGQVARIYRTEVVADPARTASHGEAYTYLKAWAYMLREGNGELIAEIESGIKREVSIGCSMKKAVCSICGEEIGSVKCGHVRGGEYDGRVCCAILSGAEDAYEWSFVAVPAQKNAGVMKKYGGAKKAETLEECVKGAGSGAKAEFKRLTKMAGLGERYMAGLREEVVRLGRLSDSGFEGAFLERLAKKLDEEELLNFKKAFARRVDELYPPVCQLGKCEKEENPSSAGEFLI